MAEAVLASRLEARPEISVGSAGTAALVGRPADPMAQKLMLERGLDISRHRGRQLTPEVALASDLVLVMDDDLKAAVQQLAPAARGRVYRLGHFAKFDIPDPVGGSRGDFEIALSYIEHGIDDFERAFWSRT